MEKKSKSFFNMQFFTSCISTMLVLLLLGMVVFFVMSARNLSTYMRENISIAVTLSDDMKQTEALRFQKQLNKKDFVKETTYISKEQALKEQTEAMGTDPAEFLGYNPFTASLEIKLHATYAQSDSIKWITEELTKNKKVLDVNYPQDLLDAINSNIRKISALLLGLAALLTMISFALINNTVRLAIYSQRFLIHTMKLVGASWGFIRRPFLMRNLWIGVIAGSIADALLVVMAYGMVRFEPQLIALITPATATVVMISVFLTGIIITLACAYISINKYLKMKASKLYYI